MIEVTNKLSGVQSYTFGKIVAQFGVDASTTEKFSAESFKYDKLYAEQSEDAGKVGWVGVVVHATDTDKGKPGPGGVGERVWASAIKLHGFTEVVPPNGPKDLPWTNAGNAEKDKWYGDDPQVFQTSRQDFVDFPGIPDADSSQKEMQSLASGTTIVKMTSYEVAILCWKNSKLSKKPLDSFAYSTKITITKDSVTIVLDVGQIYSAGGGIEDWSALKNKETGQTFTPPPQVIKNPFF
jgi:hypothetical protein